ncbi:hypothetical protein Tco_0977726 [Tanacetum coccineum]|uniref:Xylulose kinase-1 n=1 Tax=Tanacetum coccineum TaxID=301880 RepID=A0ABQ5EL46_9ASTR
MSTLTFADTHNMVAFLENPTESDGFHEMIDFLNANEIRYALTVNPTIYTSCIQQFWAMAKANTVNGKCRIQALIDKKKKVIITETGTDGVLDLEKTKDAQAKEIADLKKMVHKLERKKKSRPTGLKRLRKVGMTRRVESSKDKESFGDYEDTSKQGRSIEDIDKDADVSLVDDTQGRSDDAEMVDDEIVVDMPVGEKQEQSAKEREVNTSVEDNVAPTTIEEITLAHTLIQIKVAIEPEVSMKRKDQVALDEDLARNLQAQLEAELIEEKRLARKQDKEANIALIESWDNTQAMMEADFELA